MSQTGCQGTSTWEYQNGQWVLTQNDCGGDCLSGFACSPQTPSSVLGDPAAEAEYPQYIDILTSPQPGNTVQLGCICQ